jgi:hypothetical protein
MYRLHHQGENISELGATLAVTSKRSTPERNIDSLLIIFTLMMKAIRSSETSVLIRATLRLIPEDDILHSHRRENLKAYVPRYSSYSSECYMRCGLEN